MNLERILNQKMKEYNKLMKGNNCYEAGIVMREIEKLYDSGQPKLLKE